MTVFDYVVVGSGCAGSMAAQTLVEAGANVTMLDAGISTKNPVGISSELDFLDARKTDNNQYKYFIGSKGEGAIETGSGKLGQLTPNRLYMLKDVSRWVPTETINFEPFESLSYGGNGIGWGLQCWQYSQKDLDDIGLNPSNMAEAYEIVSGRVGISAESDYARDYTIGTLTNFQKPAEIDLNHDLILGVYKKHIDEYLKKGIYIGRTPLALLTRDMYERKAYRYREMDFYDDKYLSAWRPWITINQLKSKQNFSYKPDMLVISFENKNNLVEVIALNIKTRQMETIYCKKLLLASGAIGSGRIVLRSLAGFSKKLPILSNPHTYLVALQPTLMGKEPQKRKIGFAQMSYFIDSAGDDRGLSVASSYSYQSLMLFRLANQMPISLAAARIILQYIVSGLIIMIVQHPDYKLPGKYIRLLSDKNSPTGDKLKINYVLTDNLNELWEKREKSYMKLMRSLHTYPIKRSKTPHGSSVHYAGTIPFSDHSKELTLNGLGQLHGMKNVYVADSSGFKTLPAKGLTFTLMANAHLVAKNALSG